MNNSLHNNSIQRAPSEGTLIESEDSYNTQTNFSTGNFDSRSSFKLFHFNNGQMVEKLLRQRAVSLDGT